MQSFLELGHRVTRRFCKEKREEKRNHNVRITFPPTWGALAVREMSGLIVNPEISGLLLSLIFLMGELLRTPEDFSRWHFSYL